MRFLTIGLGHCGGKIANDFKKVALEEKGLIVEVCVINTDRADLATHKFIPESQKLLIGTGKGAAKSWQEGMGAAAQSLTNIREFLKRFLTSDTDVVLLTVGMGGGSGSGIAPTVAEVVGELGRRCIALVTLPFENESVKAKVNAAMGLDLLYRQDALKALICIDNDKITAHFPEKIITEAYEKANRSAVGTFVNLLRLARTPSLADRIDESELTSIFDNPGFATLANYRTKANLTQDLAAMLRHSWNGSLLAEVDSKTATGAIFGVQGPEHLFTAMQVDAVRRTFNDVLIGRDIMLGVYPTKQSRWTSYVGILSGMSVPKKVKKLLGMAKEEAKAHKLLLEERVKMKKKGLGFSLNDDQKPPVKTRRQNRTIMRRKNVIGLVERDQQAFKSHLEEALKVLQGLKGKSYMLNELVDVLVDNLDVDEETASMMMERLTAEGYIVETKKNLFLIV